MDDNVQELPSRAVTIAEAVKLTGLTDKAIRNRIDRGTLPTLRKDGRIRLPVSELRRRGLIPPDGEQRVVPVGTGENLGAPDGESAAALLVATVREQAEELGRLRALTEQAESLAADRARLEAQLHEERAHRLAAEAKLAALEAAPRRRRWFGR